MHHLKITSKTSMTKLFNVFLLAFSIVSFTTVSSNAQKWVADTIIVDLLDTNNSPAPFTLKNIVDSRGTHPAFISVYEQKKWLVFPVDQIVQTSLPLSELLAYRFQNDTLEGLSFDINIKEYSVKNYTTLFARGLTLDAVVELSKNDSTDTSFLGTFYYSDNVKQKKKERLSDGYQTLFIDWTNRFTSDVISVNNRLDELMSESFYHFRRGQPAVEKNLYINTELFGGLNFWGIDAAIWFSEPESERMFNRSIGLVRYVEHPDFRAIAFGNSIPLWNFRFSEQSLFSHKVAFLLGVNNWKDMDTVDHKLEEILYVNMSFTQSLNFNQFDRSGFVFGAGLMEDIHYVVYHQPKIKIGLTLNLAYKF